MGPSRPPPLAGVVVEITAARSTGPQRLTRWYWRLSRADGRVLLVGAQMWNVGVWEVVAAAAAAGTRQGQQPA